VRPRYHAAMPLRRSARPESACPEEQSHPPAHASSPTVSDAEALSSSAPPACPYSPKCLEEAFSGTQAVGSTHLPPTVRTDNAPKFRFSDTLGQEPEIELALV